MGIDVVFVLLASGFFVQCALMSPCAESRKKWDRSHGNYGILCAHFEYVWVALQAFNPPESA